MYLHNPFLLCVMQLKTNKNTVQSDPRACWGLEGFDQSFEPPLLPVMLCGYIYRCLH